MIQAFSTYIKNIALFMIFLSFIGIIVPDNKYKDYINLCLGFILIFIVAEPVLGIASALSESSEPFISASLQLDKSYIQDNIDIENPDMQTGQIILEYKKGLSAQLKQLIDKEAPNIGYSYIESGFNIDTNIDRLGNILSVYVLVTEATPEEIKKPFIWIEEVTVSPVPNPFRDYESSETSEPENEKIKYLKKLISDFYNIDSHNIYINVQGS